MRLQLVFCPDTLHRAVRHAGVAAHAAHTPALAAFWRLGDLGNDPGNLRLGDKYPSRPQPPGLKAAKAFLLEPLDHIQTRFAVVPSCPATASTPLPSRRSSTMLARSCSRTVLVVALALRRNSFAVSASA